MADLDLATVLRVSLVALGVGFLVANLRILFQFVRYFRLRSKALLTWPGRKPP